MTAEQLSLYAGVLLSLVFGYFPWLSKWYDTVSPEYKKLIMAGALLAVALGIVGIACSGNGELFGVVVTCDKAGFAETLKVFVAALIANQATYTITKKR